MRAKGDSGTVSIGQLLEAPSLAERTFKMRAQQRRKLAAAERASPAFNNQDLRLIAKMLKSRAMTQLRMDASSAYRTDGPLTLNDVPMLLKVMRDTFADEGSFLRTSSVLDNEELDKEVGEMVAEVTPEGVKHCVADLLGLEEEEEEEQK